MESALWEITQKVKNGEPLTNAEKAMGELLETQLKGVYKEIFTPEVKDKLRRALDAYTKKKSLWNNQRAFFHREIGFDFDFEKVLDFLIEKTHVGAGTFGEFLKLDDSEIEQLFDLWSAIYPEHRREDRERLRHEFKFVRQECKKTVAASNDANQEKKKTGQTKDPYNAKVKAKFLSEIIDAGIVENSTCRNNNEKFAHYAKVLQNDYGLVVSAGTLENNWNKPLNDDEKKQLRVLFVAQNLRHLAVKIATQQ
ncbi:MAG TPA: hypothetical protein DCM71_12365 [Runella sp.]|nr:hypothetical protein [Runella sp.]